MFFRNLTLFRFPTSLQLEAFDAGLAECALRPVGPMELSTRGFVSPFGRDTEGLKHMLDDAYWLASGGEDRLLPGAVVNDLLQKKLDAIEEKEGRRPGGRTRKRLKDELITELLPRAFVRPTRTDAILDMKQGVVAIDSSSKKSAENVVSEIRRALGSFPALPLNAEIAPRSVLTGWLAGEALPSGLSMGDECELRDALDQGAVVKCQRMELEKNPEIDKHLQSGKQVTRLALTLDDHVSFVLGEDLVIRKFKLLDGAVDELENTERDDMRAELEARFALMSHELRRLFSVLEPALKLSKVEA
ncbi:recombination-associated protein RdgC [Lysobacter xanthus]